ncbi:MAG: Xaa-Pro peptidase family protein [Phycisphaerae bacterium]|jgi:Xaa-Pro aminopeptidase
MKVDVLKNRLKNIRRLLSGNHFDALIVTVGANVSYLSGFYGDDSWLILTGKNVYLVTDSRYTLQAKGQCPACKIYQRKGSMIDAVADILKKLPAVKTAAVEDKIELAVFKILRKKLSVRVKAVKGLVESVRAVKDESEIAAIRRAIEISEKALAKVLPKIRVGISETALAAILDFEMKQAGANPAFETVIAFGTNSAMAHHRPTARKLKKVDTILIDFGAKINGYCADLTRCFAVGKVNNFYAKVYKTVLDAQTVAINVLKSGIKAKDVDSTAKEIIAASKLPPYGHGLGHGLGLDVHEQPGISFLSKASLQKGNVITLEPAVYLDGKFGIRTEDDVLITENGCEILTTLLKSDEVPLLKI